MRVRIDQLGEVIIDALDDYADEIKDGIQEDVIETAIATRDRLRETSPKRTGEYSKGWRVKNEKDKRNSRVSAVVHNATRSMLTVLLEYGHQKVNGGRVEGIPHIAPAAMAAEELLEKNITETIKEAGK